MTSVGVRVSDLRDRLRLPAWVRRPQGTRAAAAELSAAASALQWALIVLAGLALWLGGFGTGLSALQEQHSQHNLYAKYREELARGTAPLSGAVTEGTPVALLQSDAGGLDGLVVVEGTSSSALRAGPGHYPGSVLPGQAGGSVIFGRSVSFGGPFKHITGFSPGDQIVATTGQGQFHYVVSDVRRAGDPLPAPLPAGGSRLILVTSEGTGWRSGWAPSHAVYVDAVLKGKSVAAPSDASVSRSADQPMHGDTSGLYQLVLWLQLLLLAVLAIVIGRARWGVWQSWLLGLPIVLAALWGASNSVWLLLPNLI